MTPIYLDSNATTEPAPEVLERMLRVHRDCWGNPGSSHRVGRAARRELETAREQIADSLDADPDDVILTSGATESCNLAIRGLTRGQGTVVSLPGDHPASREAIERLPGWSVRDLPVTADGELGCLDRFDWESVRLLSMPLAHNETGVVFATEEVAAICRERGIPWHLDATQAIGRVPVSVASLGCSALSLSGHKLHGPRGIGAVVLGRGVTLRGQQVGGHQESGRRAGTEAVALAAGLAEAVVIAVRDQESRAGRMRDLRDRFEAAVCGRFDASVNAVSARRLPNTSSVRFDSVDGEAMLVALDLAGVCASLGSACASGSPEPSPMLLAMGLSREQAMRSLRFSLSHRTTAHEIDAAVEAIGRIVGRSVP